jgi:RNA polymerase sigma-70 factor (ECF subfamily)
VSERDVDWGDLMRAANGGDTAAYNRLLTRLAPAVRAVARRGLGRAGLGPEEAEDVVQETLLAIHLKRHTWDPSLPLGPWVRAIARNKLIDSMRRSTM